MSEGNRAGQGAEGATGVPAMARHIARAVRSSLHRRRQVDRFLSAAQSQPAPDSPPFVVGIDGRSGAGKSLLAHAVALEVRAELTTPEIPHGLSREEAVRVLALEDLYRGWSGLQEGLDVAAELLRELTRGQGACAPRWDWHAMAVEGTVCVGKDDSPLPVVLVVEGCGAGSDTLAGLIDLLVWMEVPESTRRARARARDGEWEVPWEMWAAQEDAVLARRDAMTAADIVVGTAPRDARG